jgi:hypothetical protein
MPKPLKDLPHHLSHRIAHGNISRETKGLDSMPFGQLISHCLRSITVEIDQNRSPPHLGNGLGMADPEKPPAAGNDGHAIGKIEPGANALTGTVLRSY